MSDNGTFDKVKGKIKETTGNVTGNSEKKAEGFLDQAVGKAKEVISDVKETAEDVKDKFEK